MMEEYNLKSYYALVWNDTLEEEMFIQGKVIGKNTELPTDPRMLYGTNMNDIMKIRNVNFKTELSYDTLTTKQSVKYIPVVEEFNVPRDVRIVVWEGSESLYIPYDNYRVLSPEDFYELVEASSHYVDSSWTGLSEDSLDEEVGWMACSDPENKASDTVRGLLRLSRLQGA